MGLIPMLRTMAKFDELTDLEIKSAIEQADTRAQVLKILNLSVNQYNYKRFEQ